MLDVILGSICEFFPKTCISKMAFPRAKQSEIWVGGGVFSVSRVRLTSKYLGYSGVIQCISNFQTSCISKTADRRAKQSEIWASGVSMQCIQGTFDT